MAQGYPLDMVVYGIVILLLIKLLKVEFPDVIRPWYSDDASALGTFANFKLYFNYIKRFFLGIGYYPKPSKSLLVVHLDNLNARKLFGLRHVFKVYTGACCLGKFIRYDESKLDWVKLNTNAWEQNIIVIRVPMWGVRDVYL